MVKKKNNDSKSLIPLDVAEEIVTNVLQGKDFKRSDKYYLYRMLGLPGTVSARLCNYHKDYGRNLDRKLREDLNVRARISKITGQIPEQYENLCKLRLVDIAEIEGQALVELKDDPKLAIEKPQLLKQLKQAAGVLGDDSKPAPNVVNIDKVQNLLLKAHDGSLTGLLEE